MKKILKSVLMLGSSQVAVTVLTIVRNKILAVILGPAGVGIFAQLQSVQNFISGLVPMGMQTGLLVYLAKYRATDRSRVAAYVRSASIVLGAVSVITVAACLVLIKPITGWTFKDQTLAPLLFLAIAGVPFLIQFQLWSTYLQAGLEFKAYSKINAMTSVASLLVVGPLVLVWKQHGAAVSLLVTACLYYLIAKMYANRSMGPELRAAIREAKFELDVLKNLLQFTFANLWPTVLWLALPIIVRTQIIADAGFRANGIYQAMFLFYNQYLGMFINAITTYSTAKISQLTETSEINKEVNASLKISILINTLAILALLLIRDFAVLLFFSRKFTDAIGLFPWPMVAAFFRFMAFTIGVPMLPQKRFRARNVMFTVQTAAFLVVFYGAPHNLRLQAATWGEAAYWSVAFLMTYFYQKRVNGYGFDKDNWRLFLISGTVVSVVAFLPTSSLTMRLAGIGLAGVWALVSIRPDEWRKLMAVVLRKSGRNSDADASEEAVEVSEK